MVNAERMSTDNSQLVKKSFYVTFVLPFNTKAKPESMLSLDANRALTDLFIVSSLSTDLVDVTDVTARMLDGDEAEASVSTYNRVLDAINAELSAKAADEAVLDQILNTLGF